MIAEGTLNPVIAHEFTLEDAAEALSTLESGVTIGMATSTVWLCSRGVSGLVSTWL